MDGFGNIFWSAEYDSFGNVKIDSSSIISNNLRLPGQYYDVETGFYYNYHRYYSSKLGRYLIPDPIGIGGEKNHLYVYVQNDPINSIDPMGLYGTDIHREATEMAALFEGYTHCAAAEVADADQGVDDDPKTWPWSTPKQRADWHFASQQRMDDLINIAFDSCNLFDLGRALHVVQDSYSHEGYEPTFGHIIDGHSPDDPKRDLDKTASMLRMTGFILRRFLDKCKNQAQKCCQW